MLTSGISAEYGRFSGGVDQRDHQERRQHVLRQLPQQLLATRVDGRDAAREGRRHRAPRQAESELRGDVRRPDRARSPVVLQRRPLAGHQPTAQTLPQTNLAVRHDHEQQALRDQGHRHARARTTRVQASYIRERHGSDARCRSPFSIDPRMSPSTRRSRTTCSSPATTACCRRSCSPTSRSRRRSSGFRGSGGIEHRHPRLAVHHPGRGRRRARRPALQRRLLRRDRSRGSQQPAVRRQPVVLA